MSAIRLAGPDDGPAIWAVLEPVIRAGDTYAIETDIGRKDALAYWTSARAYVFEEDGAVLGTYYIKPNQRGGGAHVCNCGYITAQGAEGRGIARAMLAHSLSEAERLGYLAMQFNFVLQSNARAVNTWKRAGFSIIGRQPQAFLHPTQGYVDALMMHRFLGAENDLEDG
jgi:ribosomal protein S18 acetylase RimI-like enzyme